MSIIATTPFFFAVCITDFIVADTSYVALPALTILDTASVKQNANVQLALQEVKVAEASAGVERSTLWPDVSAGYFIQSLTGNQNVSGHEQYYNGSLRFQGFMAGVSLPSLQEVHRRE